MATGLGSFSSDAEGCCSARCHFIKCRPFCACEKDQHWQQASAKNPKMMAEAFDKTIEEGLSMDPELVAAAVAAHSEAIAGAVNNPGLVASKAEFAAVNEALASMIGSEDLAKTRPSSQPSLDKQTARYIVCCKRCKRC